MTAWTQPTEAERFALLRDAKTVAIVGASPNPERSSNEIARYLKARASYDLYYVNPMSDEVLGEKAYDSLVDLPVVPDIVDVFRRSSEFPAVADEAIRIGAKALWGQLGVADQAAAEQATDAGLRVVMDACIAVEHSKYRAEFVRGA